MATRQTIDFVPLSDFFDEAFPGANGGEIERFWGIIDEMGVSYGDAMYTIVDTARVVRYLKEVITERVKCDYGLPTLKVDSLIRGLGRVIQLLRRSGIEMLDLEN